MNQTAAAVDAQGVALATKAADAAVVHKAGDTVTGVLAFAVSPTVPSATSPSQAANLGNVTSAINAVVAGAPGALNTLREIADQLAADESAAAALTTAVAGKLSKAANLADLTDPAAARQNLGITGGSGGTGTPTTVAAAPALRGLGFNWPNAVVQYLLHWDQQATTYAQRAVPFQTAASCGVKIMRTFFGTVDSINATKSATQSVRDQAWAALKELLDTANANGVQLILSNYLTQETIQALAGTTYPSWAAARVAVTTSGSPAWNGLQDWLTQATTRFVTHPAALTWEVANEPGYMLGMDDGSITRDAGAAFLDSFQALLKTTLKVKVNGGGRPLYDPSLLTDAQVVLATRNLDYLDDHFYPSGGTAAAQLAAMDTHVARVKTLLGRAVPVIIGEYGADPQTFFADITSGCAARGWYGVPWGYDAFDSNIFNLATKPYVLAQLRASNATAAGVTWAIRLLVWNGTTYVPASSPRVFGGGGPDPATLAGVGMTDADLWVDGAPDYVSSTLLASGLESIPRDFGGNGALVMTSGTMRLVYVQARESGTFSGVRTVTGAAAGALSVARMQAFAVNDVGHLVPIASTVHDPNLWSAANAPTPVKTWSTPVTTTEGAWYAFGALGVGTPGTLTGQATAPGMASVLANPPRRCGGIPNLSDIPTGTVSAASVAPISGLMYVELVP